MSQLTARPGLLPNAHAQTHARRISFFDKVDLWLSTGRSIGGLWVGSIEDKPWPGLSRVESALRLIKDRDPVNYLRVRRYLDRIWVRLISSARAEYQRQLDACVLDQRFVLSREADEIASTIIHEATHARLERWGITYDEKMRRRIEAICIRRQLNFVGKLPDGERMREELLDTLKWCLDAHDYFSDTGFEERHFNGSIEMLRHLGAPVWLVKMFSWLAERRLARRASGRLKTS